MSAAMLPQLRTDSSSVPRLRLTSRNHRKRRHHIATPLNNISLHIAILFTVGSIAWCVNGLYTQFPGSVRMTEARITNVVIWAAFAGGLLFEAGAFLTYLEACNVDHRPPPADNAAGGGDGLKAKKETYFTLTLRGPPTRTLGWQAAAVQMAAATVFAVSVITGLWAADWSRSISILFFWVPQILGGIGFIVASLIYLKEVGFTKLNAIGWHVAAWNLVGAIGFMLCGVAAGTGTPGAPLRPTSTTFTAGGLS